MNDYRSIWMKTTPKTKYPALSGSIKTDILVIGGGIAGLTTAYLLAKNGQNVVLVESGKIAEAVTGHTTAKISTAHSLIYNYLIENYGQKSAEIYAKANQQGADFIKNFILENEIDCDYLMNPAYIYTISTEKEKINAIQKEVEATHLLGMPTSLVTGDIGLPFKVSAAIRYENQAIFHPRKYLLKMAEEIQKNGGSIFEDTKILNYSNGDNYTVKSANGEILANKIIITTNFPIFDLIKFFSRTFFRQSYALAAKISRHSKIPMASYISIEDDWHSLRPQKVGKDFALIIGGQSHAAGTEIDTLKRYKQLESWAKENFDVKEILAEWSTHDVTTEDLIPYIGKQKDDIYMASGFHGWGMTNGTLAGILLSDMILNKANPDWVEFYNPKKIRSQINKKIIGQDYSIANSFIKERMEKLPEKIIADLKYNEGDIVRDGEQKVAAYRDIWGKLHAFSPKCTHLGCFLTFNNAEKTWDCPCHGSRFNFDGEVIHAPAIAKMHPPENKKPDDEISN